jgi:predicted transcriptional regulator
MSAISLRLPDSLHKKVKEMASKDNVSINQMITVALAEKLSALETEDYIGQRAKRGSRNKYIQVLRKVPNRKPDKRDRI